jgi:DNA repair exonuclease SbcCD ATPase subunit
MDNFLLLSVLGVLTIYFYSNMNVYKSLFLKITEEKKMIEEKNKNLELLKERFEKQVKFSLDTIEDSQESLKATREDLQAMKIANNELEQRNKLLQERINELYASVGTLQ